MQLCTQLTRFQVNLRWCLDPSLWCTVFQSLKKHSDFPRAFSTRLQVAFYWKTGYVIDTAYSIVSWLQIELHRRLGDGRLNHVFIGLQTLSCSHQEVIRSWVNRKTVINIAS